MSESVLLDLGDFGQVVVDPVASYVRSWTCGTLANPRAGQQLQAAHQAVLTHHLHYVVYDATQVTGPMPLDFLEQLVSMTPAKIHAGCRAVFTILADGHSLLATHVHSYRDLQGEEGMVNIEVPDLDHALQQISNLNQAEGLPRAIPPKRPRTTAA